MQGENFHNYLSLNKSEKANQEILMRSTGAFIRQNSKFSTLNKSGVKVFEEDKFTNNKSLDSLN